MVKGLGFRLGGLWSGLQGFINSGEPGKYAWQIWQNRSFRTLHEL